MEQPGDDARTNTSGQHMHTSAGQHMGNPTQGRAHVQPLARIARSRHMRPEPGCVPTQPRHHEHCKPASCNPVPHGGCLGCSRLLCLGWVAPPQLHSPPYTPDTSPLRPCPRVTSEGTLSPPWLLDVSSNHKHAWTSRRLGPGGCACTAAWLATPGAAHLNAGRYLVQTSNPQATRVAEDRYLLQGDVQGHRQGWFTASGSMTQLVEGVALSHVCLTLTACADPATQCTCSTAMRVKPWPTRCGSTCCDCECADPHHTAARHQGHNHLVCTLSNPGVTATTSPNPRSRP